MEPRASAATPVAQALLVAVREASGGWGWGPRQWSSRHQAGIGASGAAWTGAVRYVIVFTNSG